ncbi:MAG TPA: type II secretion system F family protein [Candidatus Dormibacteraeota bacterium]|nr:type II secretion system F family protein [Candidatus Dormibacteraeota bacterium]
MFDWLPAILGLIFASAIYFYFIQLDKQEEVVSELPPQDEVGALALRRRGLSYRLDRLGRRIFGNRVSIDERTSVQVRLNLAGNPGHLTPAAFEAIRYGLAALMVALALGFGLLIGQALVAAIAAIVAAALGYWLPMLLLNQLAAARRTAIERNLPDAVDLLTLAVEAGLSLDAGMADITGRFNNALGDEFGKVLREVRLGRPRMAALEDMGRRSGVAELHNLIQAITQSEQMGIGISRSLRIQATELRRVRRSMAQERAAQASLRMIFPMVGCIFPTIWIILLGPALLGIIKAWR